jgi:hypothetical protein
MWSEERLVPNPGERNDVSIRPEDRLRVHFKTWSGRCNVSVKQPVFWVGLRHSASVLPIFRHPNGSFEMHSKLAF